MDCKFAPSDHVVKTTSGLEYADTAEGKGAPVAKNQLAIVDYTLWLDDGKQIDSSKDPGRTPFRFTVGQGEVIKGWDEGLLGMRPGGKRKLKIPADLGYGSAGAGGVIPSGATLWFTVDLIKVTDPAKFSEGEKPTTENGVQFVQLLAGKGAAAMKGDRVSVNYTLFNEKVEKLDTSIGRGKRPLSFEIGAGEMIGGFDRAVTTMLVGEVRKVRIPAEFGYGAAGSGPVKPNETLWFIIELLEIKK